MADNDSIRKTIRRVGAVVVFLLAVQTTLLGNIASRFDAGSPSWLGTVVVVIGLGAVLYLIDSFVSDV